MAKVEKQEVKSKPKKDKEKDKLKRATNRPPTKVIIRHLPPTMSEQDFLKQIDPMPEHDDYYFAEADWSLGYEATCRAYITFKNYDDVFLFRDRFDGYVFVDSKGCEYQAIVEFAPFQGFYEPIPHAKSNLMGTIEQDIHYQEFLVALNQEREAASKGADIKIEFTLDSKKKEEIKLTPLLAFIANKKELRREEKKKQREEEREKRRQKDSQNKMVWTNKSGKKDKNSDNDKRQGLQLGHVMEMVGITSLGVSGSGGGAGGGSGNGGSGGGGGGRKQSSKRIARSQRRREEYELKKRERELQKQSDRVLGIGSSSGNGSSAGEKRDEKQFNVNDNGKKNSNEGRPNDGKSARRSSNDAGKDTMSASTSNGNGNGNRRFNDKRDRHRNRRDERREKNKLETEMPKLIIKKPDSAVNPIVKNFIESCSKAGVGTTKLTAAEVEKSMFEIEQVKEQLESFSIKDGEDIKKDLNEINLKNDIKDSEEQAKRELQSQRSSEERRIRNKDRPSIAIYQPKALLKLSDEANKEKPSTSTTLLSSDGETKRKDDRQRSKKATRNPETANAAPMSSDGEGKRKDENSRTKKVARYSDRRAEMKAEKRTERSDKNRSSTSGENSKSSNDLSKEEPVPVLNPINNSGGSNDG